jgi:preprotein translocase subunit YajC
VDPVSFLLLLLAVGLLFMVYARIRRQQREVAELAELQAGLAAGAEVMTGGGLFATVVDVEGEVVTLETAPGQESRWDRRAIVRIVADAVDPEDLAEEDADDEDDDLVHADPQDDLDDVEPEGGDTGDDEVETPVKDEDGSGARRRSGSPKAG